MGIFDRWRTPPEAPWQPPALTAELAGPEPGYVELPVTGQRLGPLHWRVRLEGPGRALDNPRVRRET